MGSECIDPHFLDLGTSWRSGASFTPLLLYLRGKSLRFPLDRRLGVPQSQSLLYGEEKILTLPGLELQPLGRPARRQSLYRLSHPAVTGLTNEPNNLQGRILNENG
jgi:hypothetical protein